MNAVQQIMGAAGMDVEQVRTESKRILEAALTRGVANTEPTVQRILDEVPTDALVSTSSLMFEAGEHGIMMGDGANSWGLHPNAMGQLAERGGIPIAYLRSLSEAREPAKDEKGRAITVAAPWKRELGAKLLREHYSHTPRERLLVRTYGGDARGVLSDKYRRLDSRPLLQAFIKAAQAQGAHFYNGAGSDVRVSVQMIVPRIYEPTPGECVVWGLSWQNSDYGSGAYSINLFGLRVRCLNGMIGTNAMRQQHLGRAIASDFELSQRTLELDTQTVLSATKDIVSGALNPAALEAQNSRIEAAASTEANLPALMRTVGKRLSKADAKRAKELYEGNDTIMLPPGATKWRFSNALSFMANETDSYEQGELLRRMANEVIG